MVLHIDPEVVAGLAPIIEAAAGAPAPPAGDWQTRRTGADAMLLDLLGRWPVPPDVHVDEHQAEAEDGATIPLRLYRKRDSAPGSLVVYLHGGGMIACSVDTHDPICRRYTASTGVPLLAVDFRFAPEHPHPIPVEDCYAALRWAAEHAAELGVDPGRIAVMGDSAGGCLSAAVALMARDRGGPALRAQILTQPMLDDRTTRPDPEFEQVATWTTDDNVTGWGCLLGNRAGGPDVPGYAAPARAEDLSGLPPAYIDIAQYDIFRDEDLAYAQRLTRAGVPVELHLFPSVPHSFELFAPDAAVTQRVRQSRDDFLRRL